jgi:predicted RNA-binding Zn-ribbon protein involved in translation (DUF1610 family)
MCFRKIKQIFSRKPAAPAPRQLSKREQKEERVERMVITSRGGPNMPKHQPCPACGSWAAKRDSKTVGGANYICPNHGSFFVRR